MWSILESSLATFGRRWKIVAIGLLVASVQVGVSACRSEALLGRNNAVTTAPLLDAASGGAAGAGLAMDGSAGASGACTVSQCSDRIFECGDCLDNDGDGLIDGDDVECLGDCDDEEGLLSTGIPGQNQSNCRMDCYFDNDSGNGNDFCEWDHRCDPLSVAPDFPPSGEATCAYEETFAFGETSCEMARAAQTDACLVICLELTPNGCDCFGCCELPRDSGQFVWIGNEQGGIGTCELSQLADRAACPPCTPVPSCFNPCDQCERCVGEAGPPAGCIEPTDAAP